MLSLPLPKKRVEVQALPGADEDGHPLGVELEAEFLVGEHEERHEIVAHDKNDSGTYHLLFALVQHHGVHEGHEDGAGHDGGRERADAVIKKRRVAPPFELGDAVDQRVDQGRESDEEAVLHGAEVLEAFHVVQNDRRAEHRPHHPIAAGVFVAQPHAHAVGQ